MESTAILQTNQLKLYYGDFQALKGIDMQIAERQITAFIGPRGCGKSTFLKTLNRMNDLVQGVRIEGQVLYNGQDIFAQGRGRDLAAQKGRHGVPEAQSLPHEHLRQHRLRPPAPRHPLQGRAGPAGGKIPAGRGALGRGEGPAEKERPGPFRRPAAALCIARALAVEPDVLLMDEPTSALDPASTMRIEELMSELKDKYTVVIVTHNMQQAARISDKCAFFLLGELIEFGDTDQVFNLPRDKRTEDYISGRFG